MKKLIVINGTTVNQDDKGRYSLNDLRRACKSGEHKRPSRWLKLSETIKFIKAIESKKTWGYELVVKQQIGSIQNTLAYKKIALKYANWLSPEFKTRLAEAISPRKTKSTPRVKKVAANKQLENSSNTDSFIRTDRYGRINLNDLFDESGADMDKYPTAWVMQHSTVQTILTLRKRRKIGAKALNIIWEGLTSTTYAHPLLAVEYAHWLSPWYGENTSLNAFNKKAA